MDLVNFCAYEILSLQAFAPIALDKLFKVSKIVLVVRKYLRVFFFSPVDCIHWTSAAQLSLLEDEMRRVERVNVRQFVAL